MIFFPGQRNKAAMNELTVGQKVICKHKNGRYYQCDVVQLSKETFYEVNFDDGSFSDNLFPEDIVVRFTAANIHTVNGPACVSVTDELVLRIFSVFYQPFNIKYLQASEALSLLSLPVSL